jgi:hypothetical protein
LRVESLGLSTCTIGISREPAIICWISASLMPTEVVYVAIESELERRDVP